MRNISFQLTERQFLDGSKDVTRRLGWENLKKGDRLRGCRKCMGLKRGEKPHVLGLIEIISVRREPLTKLTRHPDYGRRECQREGFPEMSPEDFVSFFIDSHKSQGCSRDSTITRIEFKHIPQSQS